MTRGVLKELKKAGWVDALEDFLYQWSGGNHWTPEIKIEISLEEFRTFLEEFKVKEGRNE